jgi:beta-lactamase superfamily II metal-dependent hydrolase
MRFLFLLSLIPWVSCSPILPIENPFEKPIEKENPEETSGEKELKIDVFGVGQGDATLVIGPSGKTLLIDAGPFGSGAIFLLPMLNSFDVSHLDWIVATHYDADHIGGIPEVLKGTDQVLGTEDDLIPGRGLIDRGNSTDKATPIYSEYTEAAGPYRQEASPGMRFDLGDGAAAEVIVVNGRYSDGREIHLNPDEENESSIGLLITYGDFQYFTAGDLTGGGSPGGFETKDLETTAGEIVGDIDVLHVGHHGSSSSTNENFLNLVKPEAAVISVGKDNDYGHPTDEVLTRLSVIGAEIYRTDLMGTLEIKTDGNSYEIAPR